MLMNIVKRMAWLHFSKLAIESDKLASQIGRQSVTVQFDITPAPELIDHSQWEYYLRAM